MQRFIVSFLIFFCLASNVSPANAFIFKKKDYKQNFINNALDAEKRNNHASAFHLFEKAMYYYGKDKKVIEEYAGFCERNKYFDKAEKLYDKLYVMSKDKKYLFKKYLCRIKNGKMSYDEFKKKALAENFNKNYNNELYESLINNYAWKNDWKNVKKLCSMLPTSSMDVELTSSCLIASEKLKDKKASLKYSIRYSNLHPKDSGPLNKVIRLAEELNDFKLQEEYVKKLISVNPKDTGIKYKLAGLYEKNKEWDKAAKLYEALMASGDKSEHVKSSYNYTVMMKNPKKAEKYSGSLPSKVYVPPKLSAFKQNEKLFYDAWKKNQLFLAEDYLNKMLKEEPANLKLLRHGADISSSQNDFKKAISYMEKISQIKELSKDEKIFVAFLNSKIGNIQNSLSIVENLLQDYPNDKKLISLAQEYSLAGQNWDKSIFYSEKLLTFEPNSEKLLKLIGDLYSMQKDFTQATAYFEKLVAKYPKTEYKLELANLYMADKNFAEAENILEPLYQKERSDEKIVKAYLNSLLAQQKTYQAYFVIKENNLLNTKEGYIVQGDLNLKNEQYTKAANYYYRASLLDSKDDIVKNNLAFCYRMLGHISAASELYNEVLQVSPENKEAKLGLGSLEIDKKNYEKSRKILYSLLRENPSYEPAKIAVAHSYIANDEKLSALEVLDSLPQNDEAKLMKAQIFYDLDMNTDAKPMLSGLYGANAEKIKYKIKRDNAITIVPKYSFLIQQLADEFNLDMFTMGIHLSENTAKNANVFMEYNVHVYYSGSPYFLTNVTNEFRGGVQARPTRNFEYRADIGVKAFQFGGALINTDSWVKYYFNDKFNLKLGFKRDNIIQSYLSAVGQYIDGVYTGRAIDNRVYLEYEAKLPNRFYSFGRGTYGLITAQNLPTNQYLEGMLGVGRPIYENPRNKWIQKVSLDVVTYNSGYQYNLLDIYNSAGVLYGGYFSPGFFTAETGNIKVEGENKKYNLKYGFSCFAGYQNAEQQHQTSFTWGFAPYISYKVNDHIDINASYNYYNYAEVQRHYFLVNAIIRGFKKNAKT